MTEPALPSALRNCETRTCSAVAPEAGGLLVPQQVDQLVTGNDPVDVQQQDRQERSLDRPNRREHAIAVDRLQRAEYPEFQQGPRVLEGS